MEGGSSAERPETPSPVRGRLAPSPTGRLHLGNAFAFLMAWLSARARGGSLVLRMEDIDPDRSRPEFAQGIVQDLSWLGLDWDRGPETQSERLPLYESVLDDLRKRGLVYPCFCTRKELRTLASAPHIGDEGAPYPGTCRDLGPEQREALLKKGKRPSMRLNTARATEAAGISRASGRSGNAGRAGGEGGARAGGPCADGFGGEYAPGGHTPAGGIAFTDAVLGAQRFSLADCGGDFALRRSDGVFAYQLAVAVDDALMGITEVVRGRDLLLSTPRQILLFALMGRPTPVYAHVPLIHDPEGLRLAKRHKGLELAALRAAGTPPEAVIGYLAFLAGLLPEPQKARAAELVPGFRLERLRGLGTVPLSIPPGMTDALLRL